MGSYGTEKVRGGVAVLKKNPTVEDIIRGYLKWVGYDGLYSDDCGCEKDDLCPWGNLNLLCQAGYKNWYKDKEGSVYWRIESKKKRGENVSK